MAKLPTYQDIAGWLPPHQMEPSDERVSIWEIRRGWRDRFWTVFSIQTLLAATFEGWFELQFGVEPTVWHQSRSIITSTVPYIVLIGPASYLITEVFVVFSEKYIEWRRRKSRRDFYAWVDRRNEAVERGEKLDEEIPSSVDVATMLEYAVYLQYHHKNEPSNGVGSSQSRAETLDSRERRVLEMEAWYGRKRLAEDRGETFSEPFPTGNGAHHSQN